MIYKSLDTIPYKVFEKIMQTNDVSLLSDEVTEIAILEEIWDKLYTEHLDKNQSSESKKIQKLHDSIDSLERKYKWVLMTCESLRFNYDLELLNQLRSLGFKVSTETSEQYYNDLNIVEKDAEGFMKTAERQKLMIPEADEQGQYNVDDIMASYCTILGYNIGKFNEITYSEYYAFDKSVKDKIKSFKKD